MFLDSHRVDEGWYPDPAGRLLMRYWNGTEWTLETRGNDTWASPAVDSAPRPAADAPEAGWAGVAFALHSALLCGNPAAVTLTLPSQSRILIDTFNHVYSWADESAQLPELTGPAAIAFAPGAIEPGAHTRSLDGLLWRISAAAFPNRLAPWLQSDDLYRMQRWPNLTTINPELDDMRQAAMLANGMFTVDELAGFSDRSIPATRALINALSLMNTLKVATPRDTTMFVRPPGSFGVAQPTLVPQQSAPASTPRVMPAPPRPGLFQRLRSKLGL